LRPQPLGTDYNAYLARLLVLAAAFAGAYLLDSLGGKRPYFIFLVIAGVVLVCIGLVLGPQPRLRLARMAVPLFDLAWITFAMYLSDGLSSFLLPALYVAVALTAMRGNRWEIGMSLAGAITAIFILASTGKGNPAFGLAVAQAALLAAGALAIRLTINVTSPTVAVGRNDELYETLLQKTSDAVFALDLEDWTILEANPAALALCDLSPDAPAGRRKLGDVVPFSDAAFLKACRQKLSRGESVVDAITYAHDSAGRKVMLRCNMTLMATEETEFVQAIMEVVTEAEEETVAASRPRDDFSVNYIPTLTHELNNHLAAIRLAAELAATTGRTPDFEQIQQQVDHCQNVLQTVVLQILRSATPTMTPGTIPEADLGTVMERALLLTRPQVLTSAVELQVDLPPALPTVVGFAHELQESLVRIIIQAVGNLAHQEVPHVLSVKATPRADRVDIVITDDGPGLTARELSIIAGRQVPASRVEDRTWEIVRDAVCRFGGDLQASNGLHGGMRLRLSVPISEPEQVVA
jgi:signal transduction histidine kinase